MHVVANKNDQLSRKLCQSCAVWCQGMPLRLVTAVQLSDVPELTNSCGSRLVLQRASLIASLADFGDKLVLS